MRKKQPPPIKVLLLSEGDIGEFTVKKARELHLALLDSDLFPEVGELAYNVYADREAIDILSLEVGSTVHFLVCKNIGDLSIMLKIQLYLRNIIIISKDNPELMPYLGRLFILREEGTIQERRV